MRLKPFIGLFVLCGLLIYNTDISSLGDTDISSLGASKPQIPTPSADGGNNKAAAEVVELPEFSDGNLQLREILPREKEPFLRMMNAPYHAKRAELRAYQSERGLGPLRIHTLYTIDCTMHSLWPALILDYSWDKVQQGGFMTRVVSGCKKGGANNAALTNSVLPSEVELKRFGAFFAPQYDHLPNGKRYAPYNRPNAMWFWMNHTDLTEDIFILLDPDMMFMTKLVVPDVRQGHPAAQFYGYMHDYMIYTTMNASDILAPFDSHLDLRRFAVGAPWMMHKVDWRSIFPNWIGVTSRIRQKNPTNWLSDMVAMVQSSANKNLSFLVIYDGMVDHVYQERAWERNHSINASMALLHHCRPWEIGMLKEPVWPVRVAPPLANFESRFGKPVTEYFYFGKFRMPTDVPSKRHNVITGGRAGDSHNILSCNCPLLQEFHTPVDALPEFNGHPNHESGRILHEVHTHRTAALLRTYIPILNDVLTIWKLNVSKCLIPTVQQEADFESEIARSFSEFSSAMRGEGNSFYASTRGDPTGINALPEFKRIVNLAQQLRIERVDPDARTYNEYEISKYVVSGVDGDSGTVQFQLATDARREIYSNLRNGVWPARVNRFFTRF